MDSHKKKIAVVVVITLIMVAYYVIYFGFLITLVSGIWKYVLGIVPFAFSALTVKVCIERIKEIQEGEEDDIGKY